MTGYQRGVTADLLDAFAVNGKCQLSVMEVDGPDISKYGVVVPGHSDNEIAGLVEKPDFSDAPSNLASIGRYVLSPDIFDTLRGLSAGSGGEIQLADAINLHAQKREVATVRLNGLRFDCGSIAGFIKAVNYEFEFRGLGQCE